MAYEITLIPGDGIGPEITDATVAVLDATGLAINWDRQLGGVAAVDATGTPLPEATLTSIRRTGLALKGPLTTPVGGGFRSINVALRQEFQLYANVRPARTIIPSGHYDDLDIVMIRENLEGLYIGIERWVDVDGDPRGRAESVAVVSRIGAERVLRYAFDYAVRHHRRKITIVHKANILKLTSGLFLELGREMAKEYADRVECNDLIVDNCAMQLVMRPEKLRCAGDHQSSSATSSAMRSQAWWAVSVSRRGATSAQWVPFSRRCTDRRPTSRGRASPTPRR